MRGNNFLKMPEARRSRIGLLYVFFLSETLLGAPLATDPNAPIYKDLGEWEARGLTRPAFMLRPYPPALIKEMLWEVVEKGNMEDRKRANAWLESFEEDEVSLATTVNALGCPGTDGNAASIAAGEELRISADLLPWLWAGGRMGVYLTDFPGEALVPIGERISQDTVYAGGSLPIEGINGDIKFRLGLDSAVYAGNSQIWFAAGYTRSSFGPFWENGVVIGPQAPGTVNYTLQGRFGNWRYSMGLFELVRGGEVEEDTGKHAMFHSFSYSPIPSLDLGLFEAIVYANRFDPVYLLPVGNYFLLQSMSGYDAGKGYSDNSLAGMYTTWRLREGLRAKALVFIDDLDFNDIIRFDWDTKWIFAGQAGVEWVPGLERLRRVALDYTMVMPYMYTHYYYRDDDETSEDYGENYQNNWTNYGENWGPELLPNSDRVALRARFDLGSDYNLELLGRFIRHGNASEGVTYDHDREGDTQDGSLTDDGWFYTDTDEENYKPSYQSPYDTGTTPAYARFLTQDVLEYVFQAGAELSRSFPLGKTNIELGVRYLFEAVWNECVDGLGPVEGNDAVRHYIGLTATVSY